MCIWRDDSGPVTADDVKQCEAAIRTGVAVGDLDAVQANLLALDQVYPKMTFAKNPSGLPLSDPKNFFHSMMVRLRTELAQKDEKRIVEYQHTYAVQK